MTDIHHKPVRMLIPDECLPAFQALKERLKKFEVDVKPEQVFRALFKNLDEEFYKKIEEELTPPEMQLEDAKKHPEIMAILISNYKKMLEAKKAGKPIGVKRGRKPGAQVGSPVSS